MYKPLFEAVGDCSGGKSLEDVFYEHEVGPGDAAGRLLLSPGFEYLLTSGLVGSLLWGPVVLLWWLPAELSCPKRHAQSVALGGLRL